MLKCCTLGRIARFDRLEFSELQNCAAPAPSPSNARICAVEKPNVPDVIQPPADEELVLMVHATGFQIYVCRPDAGGKPAWTLKAPEAELFDEQGKVIGKHFGGPTWQLNDGSQITGRMVAKVDAPDPSAIPWLLVT